MDATTYELALRKKLRFTSKKGNLTMEDLWDLSLEELDTIAVHYNAAATQTTEVSFIGKKTSKSSLAQTQFDIVKNVIDYKLAEAEKAATAADKRMQKQRILALIADKQDNELAAKGIEELTEMLNSLE